MAEVVVEHFKVRIERLRKLLISLRAALQVLSTESGETLVTLQEG